jgi:hypothetical protein
LRKTGAGNIPPDRARVGRGTDIAALVAFMARPLAAFTGTNIIDACDSELISNFSCPVFPHIDRTSELSL